MFNESQKSKKLNQKSDKDQLSDFVIHVMPEVFKQKKIVIKEDKKIIAPRPKIKPKAKLVPSKLLVKKNAPAMKKKSKLPLILAVVGLIFIIVLIALGWFAINSLKEIEEVVEQEIVIDIVDDVQEIKEDIIKEVRSGSDLDSDGLSDIEETMYGTDVRNPDSDGDTFLDGNEVFHRYSPLGESPQTLLDTGSVREYINEDFEFTLTYPVDWIVAAEVDSEFQETQEVVFRTNSTATIRIVSFDLGDEIFESWYEKNALSDWRFEEFNVTLTKEGYITYVSSDELLSYIEVNDFIYVFQYDLADELEIVYLQTFQMMINSFVVR